MLNIGEAQDTSGLYVLQISKSNRHDVTLMNVSRRQSGTYKCEVSASSPSYHTDIKKAKMEVVGKFMNHLILQSPFFSFLFSWHFTIENRE